MISLVWMLISEYLSLDEDLVMIEVPLREGDVLANPPVIRLSLPTEGRIAPIFPKGSAKRKKEKEKKKKTVSCLTGRGLCLYDHLLYE